MNSFRMKALSLAVLGLVGFGMAGSAFAACPTVTTNTGNSTPGGGGAWSSQSVGGGGFMTILNTGLNGTNCSLGIDIGTSPVSNAKGFVSDISPVNESRYRARFYFNFAAMDFSLSNYQTEIFDAFADTAPGSFNTDEIQVYILGGASPALRFRIADATQPSGFKTITTAGLTGSPTKTYYVEFDLNKGVGSGAALGASCNTCVAGAPGCFRYWVTPAGTASSDASPTATCSLSNDGWSGVTQANLGMYGTSLLFRQHDNTNAAIMVFDEFDSRRQTFIGQ